MRIGQTHAGFESWLSRQTGERWALLTACNPRSQLLSPAENIVRQQSLRLAIGGWRFVPALGVGDPDWYPEASFLVLDISPDAANGLARQYGQLAYLTGRAGHPAELCWTAPLA